jgi:hypothetical protein
MIRALRVIMSMSQMMRQLVRIVLGRDYGRITQMRRVVRFTEGVGLRGKRRNKDK